MVYKYTKLTTLTAIMTYVYALRIDGELTAVLDNLKKQDAAGFGVREVADNNEHWHFYIRTNKKLQAFRTALLRDVPGLRGNGSYSIAQCRDEEAYERYCCKGENEETLPEVVWSYGFDAGAERVRALHDAYWDAHGPAQARKRKLPVADTVLDICKRTAIKWDDRRAIVRLYIKELVSRNKPVNTFAIKAAVNVIQVHICPNDDALEELVDKTCV